MFINFSNHPSSKWMDKQIDATSKFGEIVDITFPMVDPFATSNEIIELAKSSSSKIISTISDDTNCAVMVQGEMTVVYHVVSILKKKGIKVVCACTARNSREYINDSGEVIKESVFEFVQFRKY